MTDTIESASEIGLKLLERGVVPVDTIRAYGEFFTPDSKTAEQEPLVMAFCAAAALDFAELNEENKYKIKDLAIGRSVREALGAIVQRESKLNPSEALAGVDNRAENKPKFGQSALKYFFAARILKKNFSPVTNPDNLRRQLEIFVNDSPTVLQALQLSRIPIEEAAKNILEFVDRVQGIEELLSGKPAGEAK